MKTKMSPETMYATMNPWRLFFTVALPGMISMFAMSIYSIIEGAFIGKTLGEGAFAAINIAMPLVMINFSLADLVGVGASAPISIALGRKDYKTANNVFTCSVIMIFFAAVLMGSIMYFAAVPLARLMGADDVLLDTSVRYLRTCALCSPLATVFFATDNYLRISGYVKTSMIINVASNVLTMILLVVFLMVFKMDVVGSALAISLSMCACSFVAMIPFVTNRALLRFVKPSFSFAMLKEIAACGSPVFLNNVSGRVTSILMNISLMALGAKAFGEGGGTTAVAVYAVLMYGGELFTPLMYGMSDSMSPALGYNWGAKNFGRVKKIARCSFTGTAVIGVFATLLLLLFPGTIASLFTSAEDVRLLEVSTRALRIFGLSNLFRWLTISTQSYFSAIGKPKQAAIISVGTAFVFPILLLGSLWNWGLDGLWFNNAGVNALAVIVAVILLTRLGKEMIARENEPLKSE